MPTKTAKPKTFLGVPLTKFFWLFVCRDFSSWQGYRSPKSYKSTTLRSFVFQYKAIGYCGFKIHGDRDNSKNIKRTENFINNAKITIY